MLPSTDCAVVGDGELWSAASCALSSILVDAFGSIVLRFVVGESLERPDGVVV